MTDGSLKLNETARISRSWTATISTLPWHQRVTAFCQCTTLSGSYVAFRRSVCSMDYHFARHCRGCQTNAGAWCDRCARVHGCGAVNTRRGAACPNERQRVEGCEGEVYRERVQRTA